MTDVFIPFSAVGEFFPDDMSISVQWPSEVRVYACEFCTDIDRLIALAKSRLPRVGDEDVCHADCFR